MKIGDFAKKNNISIDTVRYYISLQLLLAEKEGAQYRFTEQDSADLEEITELKNLKFSLEEIQKILFYKRLTSDKANDFKHHFKTFLYEKKQEVNKNKEEIDLALNYLNGKIDQVERGDLNLNLLGLPIAALQKLQCPYCNDPLILDEGNIERNMVISGKFNCKCNSNIHIESGIIIDRNNMKKKNVPTKREFYDKTSPKYINFLFKSMSTLIDMVVDKDINKKYILEIGSCSGFFLLNYLPKIPKDSTYIVVDTDIDRMKRLKNDIELDGTHNNFMFICSSFDYLPLMDNSVDLILDCFSTSMHAEGQWSGLNRYYKMLVSKGSFSGIYGFFEDIKETKNIPKESMPYFNKKNILDSIKKSGYNMEKIKINGPVDEGGPYNNHVEGNEYYNLIYYGKKGD